MILQTIIVLFSYLFVAVAFPGGAPESTCTNLSPNHGSSFQTSPPSFIITTNQTDSTFIVSISSNKNEDFKGFILRAFSNNNSTPIGVFTNVDANTKQICSNTAVTQTGAANFSKVTFTWDPKAFVGKFNFNATVVQTKTMYWGIQSESINYSPGGPAVTIASASTSTTNYNPQGQAANGSFACPNQECVITWDTSAQSGFMDVSLQGRVNGVTDYIAMAYSVDDKMGRDSVIACFKDPSTNQFKIILSYNDEEKSNVLISMPSSNFIINTSGDYVDGALKCKFSQLLIPYNDSFKLDKIFYPGDGNFYLLYATGPMNSDTKRLRIHTVKYSSRTAYNFSTAAQTPTSASTTTTTATTKKPGSSFVCPEDKCAFTWSKSARPGYIDFKLEGPVKSKSDYIAVGFSLDDKMGDDSVVSCYLNGTSCAIRLSKNTGKTNSYVSPPSDTFIMDKSGEYVDGTLRCSYSQAMRDGTSTSSGRKKRAAGDTVFYPGDRNYYLLYATGSIQQNTNDQLLARHNSRFASSSALNLTDFAVTSVGSSKVSNSLIKAHGILMVIAWLMCASTGMLLPRYFKSAWKDSQLCKQAVWFRLHQVMMSSVFILTSIAFIIIFCERMGYASSTLGIDSAHPPLGIIVMILVFLNPFMSLFRCAPTHENRWLFNVAHLLVGQFALFLAVINIFLSFYMKMSNMNYGWVQWVMVALIVYHTCMEILLLAHDKYLNSPAHVASSDNNFGFSEPRRETDWVSIIKTTLVICQWVGVTGLAIAICVGIGIAP